MALPLPKAGTRAALPVAILLLLGFIAPLAAIIAYSFATPRSLDVFSSFTLENYAGLFDPGNTVWLSFLWSGFFAVATVLLLAIIVPGWPRWVFLAGAVALPYLAVVAANSGRRRREPPPAPVLPSTRVLPAGPSTPGGVA